MRVADPRGPLSHRLGHRVFQGRGSRGDGDDLCPQQLHAINVERLAAGVFLPHEHHTGHAHQGRCRRRRDAVLPGSRLGDQTGLAHLLRQKRLPQHVVDLVGARVVQILALQIDLRPAQVLRHLGCVIESGRTPGILVQKLCKLPVEVRICLIAVIGPFQLDDRVHQRLGDILAPVYAKTASWICHLLSSSRTAATNAAIFVRSFRASVSIPELTSTP